MNAKEELRKLFLTEPLKIVIGLLLPPFLVFVASILPQTRDRILALVRPSLLLIIACAELLVIGGMVILIRHLQRERSSLTTELNHDSDLEYIGTKILIRSVLHARVR